MNKDREGIFIEFYFDWVYPPDTYDPHTTHSQNSPLQNTILIKFDIFIKNNYQTHYYSV